MTCIQSEVHFTDPFDGQYCVHNGFADHVLNTCCVRDASAIQRNIGGPPSRREWIPLDSAIENSIRAVTNVQYWRGVV